MPQNLMLRKAVEETNNALIWIKNCLEEAEQKLSVVDDLTVEGKQTAVRLRKEIRKLKVHRKETTKVLNALRKTLRLLEG